DCRLCRGYRWGSFLCGCHSALHRHHGRGRVPEKFWGLFWKVGALLFFFIFMIRSAFWPGTTLLFEWWIVHWTVEGMENGLWFALLVIQICGAVMLFYNITPMKDLMYAIEMLGVSHSASF